MFRKLASLLVLAMLAAPVLAHAGENYRQDRTVASTKHKKKKKQVKGVKAHAKKKKSGKAAAAKKARATRAKRGTHAPNHDVVGDGPVSHTPPMDPAGHDDLPPPQGAEGAPAEPN